MGSESLYKENRGMVSGPVPTPSWAGLPWEPQSGEEGASKEAHWKWHFPRAKG